ncbi:hypothetical protein UlMin_008562 [Ulmus minor]
MEENNLPPGFRFHPTDEELITCYLSRKVSDTSFTPKAVAVVDLNKCEPWDLPDKASMGEKEWYFFSLKDRKYPTGLRTNRATEAGYWKTTGKDKEILRGGVLVGMKKTLVFYKGRAPRGEKSNWVMHEYRLENKHLFKQTKEEWVVCRVFQKSAAMKKPQEALSPHDLSLPNLNHMANSSIGFGNNISSQLGYNNNPSNMSLNMNWAASLPSLSSWPSTLLNPNLSMNSLLLKALQLRSSSSSSSSYQPRDLQQLANSGLDHNNYSFLPQGVSQFGTDFSTNFQASSSSSKMNVNVDSASQLVQQQQQQQQQQQEQPFNLDSMW